MHVGVYIDECLQGFYAQCIAKIAHQNKQGFFMHSSMKPAFENLDKALVRLETAVEKRFVAPKKQVKEEPKIDSGATAEREVNRKIAAKLDQTINRLEMLLTEE